MLVAQIREANGKLRVWESATAPHIEALFAQPAEDGTKVTCVTVTYSDDVQVTFAQV